MSSWKKTILTALALTQIPIVVIGSGMKIKALGSNENYQKAMMHSLKFISQVPLLKDILYQPEFKILSQINSKL